MLPSSLVVFSAFKLGTTDVERISNGDPVALVDIIVPVVSVSVKYAAFGVVVPIGPGLANVAPLSFSAFRLVTRAVDVVEMVVKAPVDGVVEPIAPGIANVAPLSDDAFKWATFDVEVTVRESVAMFPEAKISVKYPALGVVVPIGPGLARFIVPLLWLNKDHSPAAVA